jgi:TonB family protein
MAATSRSFLGAALLFTAVAAAADRAYGQTPILNEDATLEAALNRLVVENGVATGFEGGVLLVKQKGGSARTRRILSDFELQTEFRLLSPETELQVGIRTINAGSEWPRRGYRLRLSGSRPARVTAKGHELRQTSAGNVTPSPAEWQSLTIKASGTTIEIAVGGKVVGTYEVDVRAGSLLFETEGGDAEVRQISFRFFQPENVARGDAFKGRAEYVHPTLDREVKPDYSANALADKVEGVVFLEAVVLADGSVGGVRLTKLLHPELEHCSLDAIRRWKFKPARLNGSPIPVIIEIEMSYSLRK